MGALRTRFDPAEGQSLVGLDAGSPFELAGLAVFGVVAELLVEEEELLSGTKDEVISAVAAGQDSVDEYHMWLLGLLARQVGDGDDIFCLWAFFSLNDIEDDWFALFEGFEA